MPPGSSVLALKVKILEGLKRFDEASKAIEAPRSARPSDRSWRSAWRFARRAGLGAADPHRFEVESEAFERLETLKKLDAPEARTALLDLARAIDEPNAKAKAESFETLADGRFLLGNIDDAIRLMLEGAMCRRDRRAPRTRRPASVCAAAILFKQEDYNRCDQVLTQLVADPRIGALRPRASLLRILAHERGVGVWKRRRDQLVY